MSDKTVPVTMPDWMWGRLATIAEYRNTDIGTLIASALSKVVEKDPDTLGQLRAEIHAARVGGYRIPHSSLSETYTGAVSDEHIERIRELRDQHMSDSSIAAELGLSRYKVQYHRSRAGIPAYKQKEKTA